MKYVLSLTLILFLIGCSGDEGKDISASGTIEGTDVKIGTVVGGRVEEVRVDEGARVKAGDTLLIVDDTEYQIQLRQAVANCQSFESAYQLAVEGSRKEDIIQAEAAFNSAEADYKRMKDLVETHTVTQKQYDDVYARYISAQQTYEKLKSGLRPEEIESARVKKESASAQVDLLAKKVHDCVILAPSDGTITLRSAEPGELVGSGTSVFRLTYLDKVKLTIYLSEIDLARVKVGQLAKVKIDGNELKSYDGTVIYISPVAEFTPKNVQTKEERTKLVFGVKIEVENHDGALKPGMPADARIITSQTGSN